MGAEIVTVQVFTREWLHIWAGYTRNWTFEIACCKINITTRHFVYFRILPPKEIYFCLLFWKRVYAKRKWCISLESRLITYTADPSSEWRSSNLADLYPSPYVCLSYLRFWSIYCDNDNSKKKKVRELWKQERWTRNRTKTQKPKTTKNTFAIWIEHGFSCINIRQVSREVLKTEAGGRGFFRPRFSTPSKGPGEC